MRTSLLLMLVACPYKAERVDDDSGSDDRDTPWWSDPGTDVETKPDTATDPTVPTGGNPSVYFVGAAADAPFAVFGEHDGDHLGRIASAGDIDDDGFADFLVSVDGPQAGGDSTVRLIHGSSIWLAPPTATFRFPSEDLVGATMGTLGDVTGAGGSSLVLTSPGSDGAGAARGTAWVLPAIDGRYEGELNADDVAIARIHGSTDGQGFGQSVIDIGDVNGDGRADIAVGATTDDAGSAAGGVWIFHGPVVGELASTDADRVLAGEGSEGQAGASLAADDLNGDGLRDVVVGSPFGGGREGSGRVDVVFGPLVSGNLAAADFTLTGAEEGDGVGRPGGIVLADLDGDGLSDLLLSAIGDDEGDVDAGAVFFVNATELDSGWLEVVAEGRATGIRPDQAFGSSLDAADVDGDGDAEVLIGAPDERGDTTGIVYLFVDPTDGRNGAGESHQVLVGRNFRDRFGGGLAVVGDADGDGRVDLVVGASHADRGVVGEEDHGGVYFLPGLIDL